MKLLNPDIPRASGATRVRAVIFDWAGTTVDFGSLAPVRTLERVFVEAGVPILEEEARRDMGIAKRDHIAGILSRDRVREAWRRKHGRDVSFGDVEILYERFKPLQLECLVRYSQLIDGVPKIVETLRESGIQVGSTTGYTRTMLDLLRQEAARQGYQPDCSFCPEDVGAGRPLPFMIYQAAVQMKVYPLAAIVKVGDTVSDIQEGLNAGAWSVGVVHSGNEVGLSLEAFGSLAPAQRESRAQIARNVLQQAGAHYVIDSPASLAGVIHDIDARIRVK